MVAPSETLSSLHCGNAPLPPPPESLLIEPSAASVLANDAFCVDFVDDEALSITSAKCYRLLRKINFLRERSKIALTLSTQ
jgi:hypothetical protein